MQSQSRRVLVIGGMIAVFLLIVVSFTLLARHDSYQSTCTKFMSYIEKQDANKSYAMFSEKARKTGNIPAWSKLIKGWINYFYKASPSLVSINDLTPKATDTNKHPAPRKEVNYIVNGPASSIRVNCYVVKTDKGYQIDGFTIGPNTTGGSSTPAPQTPTTTTNNETSNIGIEQ